MARAESLAGFAVKEHEVAPVRIFVFKDEKAGVAYVGGEREHQRYQRLCMQQHVAQAAEEEMNPSLATRWNNQWGLRREP